MEPKMDIEDSLRAALRPQDPGADFTAGVMAKIGSGRAAPRSHRKWPLALAASVLATVAGLGVMQQVVERRRAEAAAQQLALAIEITSAQLNLVHQRLVRTEYEENGT